MHVKICIWVHMQSCVYKHKVCGSMQILHQPGVCHTLIIMRHKQWQQPHKLCSNYVHSLAVYSNNPIQNKGTVILKLSNCLRQGMVTVICKIQKQPYMGTLTDKYDVWQQKYTSYGRNHTQDMVAMTLLKEQIIIVIYYWLWMKKKKSKAGNFIPKILVKSKATSIEKLGNIVSMVLNHSGYLTTGRELD